MTVFSYKATDSQGNFVEGDIDAPDYRIAVEQIRKLQYFPIQVQEGKAQRGLSGNFDIPVPGFFNRVSPKELMSLTHQLATLIDSGLTLDTSLGNLVKLADGEKAREVLADIHKRVHAGSAFADALAEHPKVFGRLYINMVRSGEGSGMLTETLFRLATYLEKAEDLKGNIIRAMIYPQILVFVGGAAIIFLFTFVIPRFSGLFDEMGDALPLPTKIMLGMSSMFTNYWWIMLIILIAGIVGFIQYLKTPIGRLHWDGLVLKMPLFGELVQKLEVSRFSLTMASLLKSGVPVLQALIIVKTVLSNKVIVLAMDELEQGLKSGKGLSGPLQKSGIFPQMAVHMITVGEASGSLDKMLAKVSDSYEKEVERTIKHMVSLIEPIMILLMALLIGFIVISMLLAVFSINEAGF
jgi:general secretion pathway protein F